MFTFQLTSFFKLFKRSIEPFSFHIFCTFSIKFSCRNDVAIAKVLYLIINDFARCKVKWTIAVVSCITVPRTECEATSANMES